MLTFFNGERGRYCDGVSRRGFLQAGALALGGLAMPDFLRLKAHGAVSGRHAPRCVHTGARGGVAVPGSTARSVIMIVLGGGPSHVDTYDMKPDAPVEIRGEFRPV